PSGGRGGSFSESDRNETQGQTAGISTSRLPTRCGSAHSLYESLNPKAPGRDTYHRAVPTPGVVASLKSRGPLGDGHVAAAKLGSHPVGLAMTPRATSFWRPAPPRTRPTSICVVLLTTIRGSLH